MKTTIENNKLIAEFIAGKSVETHHNQYHTDWNELMPVVIKIQTIGTENALFENFEDGLKLIINLENSFDKVTITKIYSRCLDFIKWYNENK